jgi:REP element-mobilizing transposase RayT
MAQIARVVVPDLPHHVTQRGNRREPMFFEADDYHLDRRLIATAARCARTVVWAYYLMPPTVKSRVNCHRNPLSLWHPASPAQSREWSGTPRGKRSYCET